jgi:Mn-dependent DtxR family transcriptional regulator
MSTMRATIASLSPLQRRLIEVAAERSRVELRPGEIGAARALRERGLVDISAAKAVTLTRKGWDIATAIAARR